MHASELQKRTTYFLISLGFVIALIVLFPFLRDLSIEAMQLRYGVDVARDGAITWPPGVTKDAMVENSVSAFLTLLHVISIVIWMALVIVCVRFAGYLVAKTFYRNAAQGEISSMIRTVLSVTIYIVAFFIVFQSQFPGVPLGPLFSGSTIIGIVVGLALQETLGNLFAGLALQADQPFQVGDVIAVANRGTGVVESVSWRGVKIRTFQNKLVIISNAVIGKEAIEVAARNNINARAVFFSTTYDASPANTSHVVREAMRHAENVSQKMRPVVRIRNLAESSIDWEVKYWLDDYKKYNDTDALIRDRIWYAFKREKIAFSTPTQNVFLKKKVAEIPIEEKVTMRAERLHQVSFFDPLSHDEIERLAASSKGRIFAPGESIVRIGQPGRSMFVIMRGSVKVQVPEADYLRTVSTLGENDFFGEMGLLTGEPRTATVTAVEETEVLQIKKDGLKPILESNPALIDAISGLVDLRRRELRASHEAAIEESNAPTTKKGVITSIRDFFGLNQT